MAASDIVGWISSFVLVLTIGSQVAKQWKDKTSEGVTPWLFIGQMCASAGFVVYSIALKSWVFVITNSLMLLSAIVGALILWRNKRREGHASLGLLSPTPQRSSLR